MFVHDSSLMFVGEWDKKGDFVEKINSDLNQVIKCVDKNYLMLSRKRPRF